MTIDCRTNFRTYLLTLIYSNIMPGISFPSKRRGIAKNFEPLPEPFNMVWKTINDDN